MRGLWALAAFALSACVPAGERVAPERLRISARDALVEASAVAATWSDDAMLRFVEGEGVGAQGYVPPEGGFWRFAYDAPGRAEQLAVTVTPRAIERVVRPPQSPPGFVLGDAALGTAWIDSPQALDAVRAAGGEALLGAGAAISLLLIPIRPPQWVVRVASGGELRQWRIDADTGEVLSS